MDLRPPMAFARLKQATEWLGAVEPNMRGQLGAYVRDEITHVECLSQYVLDLRASILVRYHPLGAVYIDAKLAPASWIRFQVALAILANNITRIGVAQALPPDLQQHMDDFGLHDLVTIESYGAGLQETHSGQPEAAAFEYTPVIAGADGVPVLASVEPSLTRLLRRDVQAGSYLQAKHGTADPVDEFDVLPDAERNVFVRERTQYILAEAKHNSSFYRASLPSLELSDAPCIDGSTLSTHCPPYGSGILTAPSYAVVFASGGTTGNPKFVYRSAWEDSENARYLGKGLAAQGVTRSDVVANCLSAGFWGGLHVFTLALASIGCSVVPLGAEFPNAQSADFLLKLRPTAILAMPSWLLSLAEHVEREHISLVVAKVITGGEILFPAARDKIRSVLGVQEFLSTGYTSNETGAIAFRCRHSAPSVYHVHENMQHVEIVSAEGVDEPVPDGEQGRIVCTNLNRTLMPLVRYAIGDLGRVVPGGCPCGRTLRRLELSGRCDGRIRLGGEDLFVEEIATAISSVPGLSLHFTLHVSKSDRQRDELEVHVESRDAALPADDPRPAQLRAALARHTALVWSEAQGTMEEPIIVIVPRGTLPRNPRTGKIPLVVDRRK